MSDDFGGWFVADDGPTADEAEDTYGPDEVLIDLCYELRGLRLNLDTVRGWEPPHFDAALAWVNADGAAPEPAVIVAARAEYAAARKCRACGCTDYFACPGGCTWVASDLCSACVGD